MAAIKEKFRDQLGSTFASSSTPIDPQVYAQHLTQMRQQCGLVATPITTGQVNIFYNFLFIFNILFFFLGSI
jgi:hypothetical protein